MDFLKPVFLIIGLHLFGHTFGSDKIRVKIGKYGNIQDFT